MATNKHAIIRYQTLDKCFRNPGRRYFIDDLIEECNISIYDFTGIRDGIKRRQIFEDIKFMESSQGWSISLNRNKAGKKVYYRYLDTDFSINSTLLNQTEELQLKEVLLTLARFKGMPQFEWIEEILVRLELSFTIKDDTNKFIDFEQNQFLQGLDFFSTIFNAIVYQRTLVIRYKSFKQTSPSEFVFHAYYLKQYNSRWFVFGKSDYFGDLTNIALDRIETVSESSVAYKKNDSIDFEEYFEDIVGVTIPRDLLPIKVILKVNAALWPYIKTKPIHGSQKVKEITINHTIIELLVIINYELTTLLFSYGEDLVVLEPITLAEDIKKKAENLIKGYL